MVAQAPRWRGEVMLATGQLVGMRQRHLHRQAALGRADVNKGLILLPGKFAGNGHAGTPAEAGHSFQELMQASGVPVQRRKKILTLLICLALEGGLHSREKLAAFFWPHSDVRRSRGPWVQYSGQYWR
jgi:hypothetical protein